MKTGIIGLPQVGKTSLFQILTKAHLSAQARANPREAHIGVAKVPDDRLDRLAALYNPKKLTHTSVEYVDVGAIGQDALKDTLTPRICARSTRSPMWCACLTIPRYRTWARSIRCAISRMLNST
jgi:hypothetical protein